MEDVNNVQARALQKVVHYVKRQQIKSDQAAFWLQIDIKIRKFILWALKKNNNCQKINEIRKQMC